MAKGINISIASDTHEFSQGVKRGVIDPLDDAEDALKDVAKQGDKAGDKLERSFKDATHETSDFKREQKELGEAMQRAARTGGRSWKQASDDVETSSRHTSESVKEFGDEAKQNIGETFSSFRGDVTDFGQIAQDTLGGLTSGLEGIPAVAAVAAGAAGIGLVIGAITNANTESEAFKEKVSELAKELIDAGNTGERSFDDMIDALKDMATATDDGTEKLKDLRKISDQSATGYKHLADVYVRGGKDLNDTLKKEQERFDELYKRINKHNFASHEAYQNALDNAKAQGSLVDFLKKGEKAYEKAQQAQQNYVAAGGPALQQAADAAQAYAEGIQSSLSDAGESWSQYTTNGVTDLQKYNDAIDNQQQAIQDYKANIATASKTLSQDALNYIESLGPKAAPLLQSFVDAPLDQKQRTAANWDELGKTSGDSYTSRLEQSIPKSVDGPTVKAKGDDSDVTRMIRKLQRKHPVMYVTLKPRPGRGLP